MSKYDDDSGDEMTVAMRAVRPACLLDLRLIYRDTSRNGYWSETAMLAMNDAFVGAMHKANPETEVRL